MKLHDLIVSAGPLGFEPRASGSADRIELDRESIYKLNGSDIDWEAYEEWLARDKSRRYVKECLNYAKRYVHCLLGRDFSDVRDSPITIRPHIVKALSNLSKFLGMYDVFKELMRKYGISWKGRSTDDVFIDRLLSVKNPEEIWNWIWEVKKARPELSEFMDFVAITGLRLNEAVKSYNLVQKLGEREDFIEHMRSLLPAERFQREFEAKFVEDIDAWLPQSLIVRCIESSLEPYDFMDTPKGAFFIGVDFGKHQDYSVVAVVRKDQDAVRLVHLHRFPLETQYASVIGYLKSLCDRWRTVHAVYADITGVGEYICEDMRAAGIPVEGVTFTIKSKEDMATVLREKMRRGEFKIPYVPAKSLMDIISELNVERFELALTGHIKFSHPEGTHDDVFWSVWLFTLLLKAG